MFKCAQYPLLVLVAAFGLFSGSARVAHAETGDYTIAIAGSYSGTGKATLTDTTVSITGTVTDENGTSGSLIASNLAIYGNHFSGSGTVMGNPMTVLGRLDPADAQGKVPKTARLMGTFTVSSSTHGRLAGFVPVIPGAPSGGGGTPSDGGGTPPSDGGGTPPGDGIPPKGSPPDGGGKPGGNPKSDQSGANRKPTQPGHRRNPSPNRADDPRRSPNRR